MVQENGADLSTVLTYIDEFIDIARTGGGYAITWEPNMAHPQVTALKSSAGGIPLVLLVVGGFVLLFLLLK